MENASARAPDTVGGEQVIHQVVVKFSPGNAGGQTTDLVRMILPMGVLIAQAYGLPAGSDGRSNGRVVGGPDWMTRDSEQLDSSSDEIRYRFPSRFDKYSETDTPQSTKRMGPGRE